MVFDKVLKPAECPMALHFLREAMFRYYSPLGMASKEKLELQVGLFLHIIKCSFRLNYTLQLDMILVNEAFLRVKAKRGVKTNYRCLKVQRFPGLPTGLSFTSTLRHTS